jgi:DNA (cytosine-5)-methyltransferase 1
MLASASAIRLRRRSWYGPRGRILGGPGTGPLPRRPAGAILSRRRGFAVPELATISARPGRWASHDPLALPTVRGERLTLAPKAGAPDPEDRGAVIRWLQRDSRPTAVDLFCGAGGLSWGLEEAGFRVIAAADRDEVALETHRANLGGLTWSGDLSETTGFIDFLGGFGIERVALVAGGPPCQPFSRAGESKIRSLVRDGIRQGRDERVDLWTSFVQVVDALQPDAVLFENVPDLARWNDGEVLLGILHALREREYSPYARILQGFDHGVPQHRARLFVVGLQRGNLRWPNRVPVVKLDDAISDLPAIVAGDRTIERAYKGPKNAFQKRARRRVPHARGDLIHDHVARAVRQDDAQAFELLRPGQTYRDLPDRFQRYRSDIFDDKYKRLNGAEISRTITAHIARDGYWYIHPRQTRTLSIREAARVQTFPDRFRFAGHSSVQFRQIGNAVPPALARAVARRVLAALRDDTTKRSTTTRDGFAHDLVAWFEANKREFPWRQTSDPWLVLLAELCLRRTRAAQVAERFAGIRDAAPTPRAALENALELRFALAGLGLELRADNLIQIARILVDQHDGRVPESDAALRALPGVGHYAAAAVRSFAFGKRTVLFDTNTKRIAARLAGRPTSSVWETRLDIFALAGSEEPTPRFNLALLDLGALICRAGAPRCEECPVMRHCRTGLRRRASRARVGTSATPPR